MAGFSKSPGVKTPNQGGSKPPPVAKPKPQGGPPNTKFTTPEPGKQYQGKRVTPVGGSGTKSNTPKPFKSK
jgi:hypothetical protein